MSEDGEGRREVLARENIPMSHQVRGRCLVAGGWQLRLIGASAENRCNSSPYFIPGHFRSQLWRKKQKVEGEKPCRISPAGMVITPCICRDCEI